MHHDVAKVMLSIKRVLPTFTAPAITHPEVFDDGPLKLKSQEFLNIATQLAGRPEIRTRTFR